MNKYEKSLERIKKNLVPADNWTEEDRMHSLTVIEALEKQIPKKVTHEASLFKCCTCPNCKNVVDKFEQWGETRVRIKETFCHFCGQALDWEV